MIHPEFLSLMIRELQELKEKCPVELHFPEEPGAEAAKALTENGLRLLRAEDQLDRLMEHTVGYLQSAREAYRQAEEDLIAKASVFL